MRAYLTNFGARMVGLEVPDKEGNVTDVVLGFRKASDYYNPQEPFFGPIVGPFGNRISGGKLKIGEETYQLSVNNGPNTLHGGFDGVHFAMWERVQHDDRHQATFSHTLPDGKEGFSGNISMKVTYSIGNVSGIMMDIYTEDPGIQFYSGNFMSEKMMLKNETKDTLRSVLCLEPQHFPDSPNQPHFLLTVREPGDTYKTKSVYTFSVK